MLVVLRLRSRDIDAFAAKEPDNVWAPVASIPRAESRDYLEAGRSLTRHGSQINRLPGHRPRLTQIMNLQKPPDDTRQVDPTEAFDYS